MSGTKPPARKRNATKRPRYCFLRGETWWAEIVVSGIRHRQSLRTGDAEEAALRVAKLKRDLDRQAIGFEGEESWRAAVVRWINEGLGGVKPSVAQRYLTSIRSFDSVFDGLLLAKIGTREIADWVRSRKEAGQRPRHNGVSEEKRDISNASIQRDLTALSRLMSFCCSIGWRTDNPVQAFDRSIIRERRDPKRPPTQTEINQAIEAASPGVAGVLRLLAETGMRMEEAVTLEWKQIDETNRQMLLTKTKTSRPRAIAWLTPGGNASHVIMNGARKGALYPSSTSGEAFANFSSNHAQLMRRMLKDNPTFQRFNVHSLRHAFAIRWLKAGGNIYRLSRHLGHSSVKVTEQNYLGFLTVEEQEKVQMEFEEVGA